MRLFFDMASLHFLCWKVVNAVYLNITSSLQQLRSSAHSVLMRQFHSNFIYVTFLFLSFYNLRYVSSAAVAHFKCVTVEDFIYFLEENVCLLIAKTFFEHLFLHLKRKVG